MEFLYLSLTHFQVQNEGKKCFSSANDTTNIATLHYSANCFHLVSMVRTLCLNTTEGFPTSTNPTRNRPKKIKSSRRGGICYY